MASFLRYFPVFLLFSALATVAPSGAGEGRVVVDLFSIETDTMGRPYGWKPLRFPKIKEQTKYTVELEDGNYFLRAESIRSASALYRKVEIDLKGHPVLSWRWKVEGVLKKGDETIKEGDDYSGRVYVTFEYDPEKTPFLEKLKYRLVEAVYGTTPPGTSINYIWANRLEKGSGVPNPFTEKAMMIAVESGPAFAGRWIEEERNVYEDYKRFFGEEPPKVTGVAVMTDSDNTEESAVGYYDDIIFKKAD